MINPVSKMCVYRGTATDRFGLDNTGTIQYRFNRQGFRSDRDFDFVPSWAFFGCSLVAGIGVPIEQTFASKFANSQNYGVCGTYDNREIRKIIQNFIDSDLYDPQTKMAVFWTDRDSELLDKYYHELCHLNMKFFFCGDPLPYHQCYKVIKNLDLDVSGTHMGPKTHEFLYRTLCQIYNQ